MLAAERQTYSSGHRSASHQAGMPAAHAPATVGPAPSHFTQSLQSLAQRRQIESVHSASRSTSQMQKLERLRSSGDAVVQRTIKDAELYGPTKDQSMSPNFRDHHSSRSQSLTDELAISNHEARSKDGPNTTLEMGGLDAQYELMVHLESLSETQSEVLQNEERIFFVTNATYKYIETSWNGGDPVVVWTGEKRHHLGASFVDRKQCFSIFHYGPE